MDTFESMILRNFLRRYPCIAFKDASQLDKEIKNKMEKDKAQHLAETTMLTEQLQASEYRYNALVRQVDALKSQVESLKGQLKIAEQVKEYALQVVKAATESSPKAESDVKTVESGGESGEAQPDKEPVKRTVQVVKIPVKMRKR